MIKDNQEGVWDSIAKSWDQFRYESQKEVRDFLIDKKGRIIDLACGSGRNFVPLEGTVYYGVDFSSKMLEHAEVRAEKLGVGCILMKSEASNLPFENDFFDCGLYIAGLHCVDNERKREESIKELFRVMKKGGEVLISVWSKNHPRVKNKGKEAYIPWTIEKNKVMRYYYIYDKDEIEKIIKKAGFKIKKYWEDENIWITAKK